METITEGMLDFKSLEQTVFGIVCQLGRELIEEYLRIWDNRIMALRDMEMYRAVNTGTTTIKTVMGEVRHARRRYRQKTGGYVFLLDEALGLGGGCGLVSENLAEQIVIGCTEKPFRKVAESISSGTGQAISAMGAWGVLQRFGEKLAGQVERLNELDREGTTGQLGNIFSRVLFGEMDDVWVPMQKESRRKRGEPAEPGARKAGNKPIHVGTAYTGWEEAGGGKYRVADKFAYAGFGPSAEFASTYEMLLRHRFDMDGVERRVVGGDGAGWIRTVAEDCDAIMQLDPFHRSRAILRAVSGKKGQGLLFAAIRDKDVGKALRIITDLIADAEDDAARKKLGELFRYFYNNKEYLLTWQERGIGLPEPEEGIVYRNLGTQEASNCDLITQRMKHRKGSWTATGGGHMAMTLCFRHTIGLDEALGLLPVPTGAGIPPGTLSAAKVPLHDGKGYGAAWMQAAMPIGGAFVTNGREAILGLARQRPIADLSFI